MSDGDHSPGPSVEPAHAVRVKRASSNFSVGNNTLTAVAFDAEDYDTDNMHDNSTNNTRLTVPALSGILTSLWYFYAFGYTDVTSGRADCEIRLNGSTIIALRLSPASSGASGYDCFGEYIFSAGDYIECLVRTTGGAGNAVFDPPSPTFGMSLRGKVT